MASRQQLFARLTDLSLSLEMWEQTGVLYMPAFFDYLREAGIFQRVELILSKIRPEERVSITQKCYDLLCETIKQDPAYYALVVACREDQNWRLLHRPEITAPHGSIMKLDDVTFSVANHQLQQMVEENEKEYGDISFRREHFETKGFAMFWRELEDVDQKLSPFRTKSKSVVMVVEREHGKLLW
ncbi:uncharacterized protein N7469_007082 [Penicillium citrinum]|uniref:Uncharacterized protein n=1 Tax=Penicillium citrinum TaxID=5077 RepID=A0A9W9TLC8_PENCI|nr:uncharacterized protein N7469_007082 [Penicillium citrinum]KAJ5227076.1 hypothetical protein N7469_007082 [Penicillium citrinum]